MTRDWFLLLLMVAAAVACRDERDVVQLRAPGHEWTAEPDPAFADAARLGLLYTDMVAAFAIADSLVATVPTNGTLVVGSSMTGALLNPWVIEASQGRDLLTTSGDNTRVDFMGGPCSAYEYLCFRGRWTYHQPDGTRIVLGSVDSAGRFSFAKGAR